MPQVVCGPHTRAMGVHLQVACQMVLLRHNRVISVFFDVSSCKPDTWLPSWQPFYARHGRQFDRPLDY